jgi:hypothetical protein
MWQCHFEYNREIGNGVQESYHGFGTTHWTDGDLCGNKIDRDFMVTLYKALPVIDVSQKIMKITRYPRHFLENKIEAPRQSASQLITVLTNLTLMTLSLVKCCFAPSRLRSYMGAQEISPCRWKQVRMLNRLISQGNSFVRPFVDSWPLGGCG